MIDSKLEVKNNRNKSSEKELEVSNWSSVPQADKVWKHKCKEASVNSVE